MRVLIVEDHKRLAALTKRGLEAAGFDAETVGTSEAARDSIAGLKFDALVLDLGLPDEDGLQFLTSLRAGGDPVPVLILTSRVQLTDRVNGLDSGADDYLVKPFEMDELAARLRALLRRPSDTLGKVLRIGNLNLDETAREIRVDGQLIALSKREIDLLEYLMRRAGRVVPKTILEDSLYGTSGDLSSNSVEVLTHRLRAKLANAGAEASVETVRGIGYRILETAPT